MDATALVAALGVLILAAPTFFVIGRRTGTGAELRRQAAARATAEETSRRIVGDAEREAETLRKSAIVSGKEELIGLREQFEIEVRSRREEVERDERRLAERDASLDRKSESLDQ